jgi:hypothetical protein
MLTPIIFTLLLFFANSTLANHPKPNNPTPPAPLAPSCVDGDYTCVNGHTAVGYCDKGGW